MGCIITLLFVILFGWKLYFDDIHGEEEDMLTVDNRRWLSRLLKLFGGLY